MSLNVLFDNGTHKIESSGEKAQPQAIRKITKGAFYSRFTLDEAIALEDAQQTDKTLKVLDKRLNLRSHVDLDFPELLQGLSYMVSKNIITQARADELRADGEQHEAFTGTA